ncbi:MAG: carboxypeptidase-like regulatory domain-containing protein [Gemmatimonadales bacterium]
MFVASWHQVSMDTSARIRGQVNSARNGGPLPGVMISVASAHRGVVTDSEGTFALDGLTPGPQLIHISYEGRETQEYQFNLRSGRIKRIAIVLDSAATDLAPVVAEAQNANTWQDLAGFYARMREYRGFARFFTREEIEHIRPRRLSTLLILEGIRTRCLTWCLPTRFSRGALCAIPISVDGMPLREDDYDRISVSSVVGVEVYRGVPPNGLSPGLAVVPGTAIWMGGGGSYETTGACGLVAIWTR